MRFKLTRGKYVNGKTADGKPIVMKPGDIVESDVHLDKRFGRKKFERLDDSFSAASIAAETAQAAREGFHGKDAATAVVEDTLSAMTVSELRQLAEEEELDLGRSKTKDELLAAIRVQRG